MIHLLDQLTKLAESGRKLTGASDLDELYENIFDLVTAIFDNQTAAILLRNPKDGTLSIVASRGYDPEVVKRFKAAPGQGVTGHVLQSGEPQLVTETVNDPRYICGVPKALSEIAVPLRSGDDVIGVLDMESAEHRFTTADQTMFVTLGEQVVTAIRNIQLKASLEERARKLVSIAKMGQSLIQEPDLDKLLERVVDSVHEALRLDTSAIMMWDETRENMVVVTVRGYDRDVIGLSVARGSGVTGKVAQDCKPCIIDDVTQIQNYIPGLEGCRSEMAVPLMFQGEVIGILNVEHREVNRFDETDLLHATIFADQAASAIATARIRKDLTATRREVTQLSTKLGLLAKTSAKLTSISDLDTLLDRILTLARDILGFGQIALLLPEPSGLHLKVSRSAGFDPGTEGRLIPVEGSISGAAYNTATSQLVPDVTTDPNYVSGCENARSNVAVPLIVEDDAVGVLVAESIGDETLTEVDVEVLETLASQVASVVQAARQRTDLAERSRRLTMIHRAACSLNAIEDPEEMLTTILQMAKKALGFDAVAILTPSGDGENLTVRKALDHGDVEGLKMPIGTGFVGEMFVTGKAHIIDDIEDFEDYIPGTPGARCEMAVPLTLDGNTIGILDAEAMEPYAFTISDLELFRVFGSQVATALKNAGMIHDLEDRANKLTLIHRAACSLNAIDDPEEMLTTILQLAKKALGFDAVAILTPSRDGENLTVRKALDHGDVEGLKMPIGTGFVGEMFVTGEARIIDDINDFEDYIPGTPGARCEMAVPLTLDGNTIGILDAEAMVPHAFTTSDLDLFRVFGSQVATALKNAGMIQDLEDRAKKLTLIHRAACSLNAIDEPDEMLDIILSLAQKALGFDAVAILIPDKYGKHLTVRRAINHGDVEGLQIPIGEGFVGEMFITGKAYIIDDIEDFENYIPGTPGARCEMAVPLSLDGETIGILDAESMEPNTFTEEDLKLFRIFGSQAATALHNARMIANLESRSRRLASLNQAARALNSIHDPTEILDKILETACTALDINQCALLLTDPDDNDLILHAAIGYGYALGTHIPLGEGITGRAAQTGETILINDTLMEESYVKDEGKDPARSELASPLTIMDKTIGVFYTKSPHPNAFNEHDADIFKAFAAQAAVAIHNARLIKGLEDANRMLGETVAETNRLNKELENYAEQISEANKNLERQVLQLTTLHEAGRTITSSLDLDTTLHTILSMTSKIIGSTAGAIKLIDEETKELRIKAEEGKMMEGSGSRAVLDLPLRIGDRTIGVFELVREARDALDDDEKQMLETMASQAAIAIENARLFENTQRVYYETLKSLAGALEARDDYTRGHSERVAKMSKEIAVKLDLRTDDVEKIHNAALLHDIGKIGIRDEVLLAPRKLTVDERTIIEQHPSFGNTILRPLKFLGDIREYVRFHHERWDGTGYPDGRKETEIPLASRIIAVADTYDAMTSTRPYRAALSAETAIDEITKASGSQFDPSVVKVFLKIVNAS